MRNRSRPSSATRGTERYLVEEAGEITGKGAPIEARDPLLIRVNGLTRAMGGERLLQGTCDRSWV
ncbi:MAG: hypothetical protein LC797_10115, partial [Chloroflexi bacterium]|nr:hypothetical protein [Chloroflexota bacterium]